MGRRGQIETDRRRRLEQMAVLPADTDIPALLKQCFLGDAVVFEPVRAVQQQHVRPFGAEGRDAVKMGVYVVAGEIHVVGQHRQQLTEPVRTLVAVGADQRVLGEDVHRVVDRFLSDRPNPLPHRLVVNDAVGTDQAGQVEGLARRVKGRRVGLRPGIHRLNRCVAVAVE